MDSLTKKSLGHFPIGSTSDSSSGSNRKYAFIRDINGDDGGEQTDCSSPFDVTPEDIKRRMKSAETGEPLSAHLAEREIPQKKRKRSKKKVVSYYLEEALINRLKSFADAANQSYSAAASEAIEGFVSERGY